MEEILNAFMQSPVVPPESIQALKGCLGAFTVVMAMLSVKLYGRIAAKCELNPIVKTVLANAKSCEGWVYTNKPENPGANNVRKKLLSLVFTDTGVKTWLWNDEKRTYHEGKYISDAFTRRENRLIGKAAYAIRKAIMKKDELALNQKLQEMLKGLIPVQLN